MQINATSGPKHPLLGVRVQRLVGLESEESSGPGLLAGEIWEVDFSINQSINQSTKKYHAITKKNTLASISKSSRGFSGKQVRLPALSNRQRSDGFLDPSIMDMSSFHCQTSFHGHKMRDKFLVSGS